MKKVKKTVKKIEVWEGATSRWSKSRTTQMPARKWNGASIQNC